MTKLEEAMKLLREVIDGISTIKRLVYEIEKYQSSSGNITWRGLCEDGSKIYFRQSQMELYQDSGCWDWLNSLGMNVVTPVEIKIETIPDGNFFKIVSVSSWCELD